MATDVSICSNALLMLGDSSIQDLAEENDRARLASNLFPQVRDAVLRLHPWNCAVKRVALAPDVATPVIDYAYQFTLPSDWVRTLQVGEYGCEDDHRSEGRKILADCDPLYLRYIFQNTVVATWDTALIHAVSLLMKAAMAYGITKSMSVSNAAMDEALAFLKVCRAIDGQDDPPETLGDFRLLTSRFGGRSF
jgi:hypothetical protein